MMIKLDVWKFLQGRQRMLTRDLLRYKTLLSNATLEVLNRNLGVPQQPPPLAPTQNRHWDPCSTTFRFGYQRLERDRGTVLFHSTALGL